MNTICHKGFGIISILCIIFFTSGCFVTKTATADDLSTLQYKRELLRVHSGGNIWIIKEFRITNDSITGTLSENNGKLLKSEIIDIYVAPSGAISARGDQMTIPVDNIGKVDYPRHSALQITGASVLAFLFFVFPGLFAM